MPGAVQLPAPMWYRRPVSEPAVLSHDPALASWMRRGHPDQQRLEAFLTAIDEDAEPALARIAGDVALELIIGLPPDEPLTRFHDLDNFLQPVVERLGQRRIPAVFACKHHAATSSLTVAPAAPVVTRPASMLTVRTAGSYERPAWKEQIRDACSAAMGSRPPHPGTATLEVSFVVSSLRNWTTLWKPAIDAIAAPLLGVPDTSDPWSPNDDHITRLGLHRTIDDSVDWDVVVNAWWHLH